MSRTKLKLRLRASLVVLTGLALGAVGSKLYDHQQRQSTTTRRSVASIKPYSPAKLKLGKQAVAMNVEIAGPESYPDSPNEIVELVGFITQNISGDHWLDYAWVLPEGVTLVQGPTEGSLQEAPLGVPQRMSILVTGFHRQKQNLIVLNAKLEKAGTVLAGSAVVVSRPEDTMEARVIDLAEKARALKAESLRSAD